MLFFLKKILYLFSEREEDREKERETNINQSPLRWGPSGDLAHNPGMCPDWESNLETFQFTGQRSIH